MKENTDKSMLLGPHYTIPQRPDFLDDSFVLFLTEQSKALFDLGAPGQGYSGLVNLETGEIHLVPAFNKDDGLLRLDKNGAPFKIFVDSKGGLGQQGNMHKLTLDVLDLDPSFKYIGNKGNMMGFGIWKQGTSVKFQNTLPGISGLVPNEVFLIKNKENGSYKLYEIDELRNEKELPIQQELGEFLKNCESKSLPIEKMGLEDKKAIAELIRKNYTFPQPPVDICMKSAKNRCNHINNRAVQYSKEYIELFYGRVLGESSHQYDLERELPLEVIQKILRTINKAITSKDTSFSPSGPTFPDPEHGVALHLLIEEDWQTNIAQTRLESGILSGNRSRIEEASYYTPKLRGSILYAMLKVAHINERQNTLQLMIDYAKGDHSNTELLIDYLNRLTIGQRRTPESLPFMVSVWDGIKILQENKEHNQQVLEALHDKRPLDLATVNPNYTKNGLSVFSYAIQANAKELIREMFCNKELTPLTLKDGLDCITKQEEQENSYNVALVKYILKYANRIHCIDPKTFKSLDFSLNVNIGDTADGIIIGSQTQAEQKPNLSSKTLLLDQDSYNHLICFLIKHGEISLAEQIVRQTPESISSPVSKEILQTVNNMEARKLSLNFGSQARRAEIPWLAKLIINQSGINKLLELPCIETIQFMGYLNGLLGGNGVVLYQQPDQPIIEQINDKFDRNNYIRQAEVFKKDPKFAPLGDVMLIVAKQFNIQTTPKESMEIPEAKHDVNLNYKPYFNTLLELIKESSHPQFEFKRLMDSKKYSDLLEYAKMYIKNNPHAFSEASAMLGTGHSTWIIIKLQLACLGEQCDLVKQMIKEENYDMRNNFLAFQLAIDSGSFEIVTDLLNASSPTDRHTVLNQHSCIRLAAEKGDLKMVQCVLKALTAEEKKQLIGNYLNNILMNPQNYPNERPSLGLIQLLITETNSAVHEAIVAKNFLWFRTALETGGSEEAHEMWQIITDKQKKEMIVEVFKQGTDSFKIAKSMYDLVDAGHKEQVIREYLNGETHYFELKPENLDFVKSLFKEAPEVVRESCFLDYTVAYQNAMNVGHSELAEFILELAGEEQEKVLIAATQEDPQLPQDIDTSPLLTYHLHASPRNKAGQVPEKELKQSSPLTESQPGNYGRLFQELPNEEKEPLPEYLQSLMSDFPKVYDLPYAKKMAAILKLPINQRVRALINAKFLSEKELAIIPDKNCLASINLCLLLCEGLLTPQHIKDMPPDYLQCLTSDRACWGLRRHVIKPEQVATWPNVHIVEYLLSDQGIGWVSSLDPDKISTMSMSDIIWEVAKLEEQERLREEYDYNRWSGRYD